MLCYDKQPILVLFFSKLSLQSSSASVIASIPTRCNIAYIRILKTKNRRKKFLKKKRKIGTAEEERGLDCRCTNFEEDL